MKSLFANTASFIFLIMLSVCIPFFGSEVRAETCTSGASCNNTCIGGVKKVCDASGIGCQDAPCSSGPTSTPKPQPTTPPGSTPLPTVPGGCNNETNCACGDEYNGSCWVCKTCNNPTPTPLLGVPSALDYNCTYPGNSTTVSWAAAPHATYYSLRVNNTIDGWNGTCTSPGGDFCADVSGTSYTFSLDPDATYTWFIHARRGGEFGTAVGGL